MIANLFVVVIASIALLGNGYLFRTNYRLHGFIARPTTVSMAEEMDPNFEEHLPGMMRAGSQERPSYDLASELRQKYKRIQEKKRQAATSLKTINPELAIEVEIIDFPPFYSIFSID